MNLSFVGGGGGGTARSCTPGTATGSGLGACSPRGGRSSPGSCAGREADARRGPGAARARSSSPAAFPRDTPCASRPGSGRRCAPSAGVALCPGGPGRHRPAPASAGNGAEPLPSFSRSFSTLAFQAKRRGLLARGMCLNCAVFCKRGELLKFN